ncbi:MAG TPA: hypothetical protein VHC69_32850 [Polyangiaceae bacterium]|nr:hypothetical protein [Polyangiaceae bacterium]
MRRLWCVLFAMQLVACAAHESGVDSESHFFGCTTDSACQRLGSGAECVNGTCQVRSQAVPADAAPQRRGMDAAVQASDVGAGPPATALATGQALPSAIAVDGTDVYWFNLGQVTNVGTKDRSYVNGQIAKCAIAGCDGMPAVLAIDVNELPMGAALTADKGNVFWTAEGNDENPRIFWCSADNCPSPTSMYPALYAAGARSLFADGTNLYWTTTNTDLSVCDVTNCRPKTLSALTNTGDTGNLRLIADEATLYWIRNRDILKCDKAGCGGAASLAVPPSTLVQKSQPFDLAVDANYIYWTTWDISDPSVNGGFGIGQVLRCEKSGCQTPVVVVSGLLQPAAIATDGTNVYWSETADPSCCSSGDNNSCCTGATAGRIAKCAVTGCDVPTVLTRQVPAANLVVDAWNIYFTTTDANRTTGNVMRIPK